MDRTLLVFILTDDKGHEYRFERYVLNPWSRMDYYLAEDSAIVKFRETFGRYPSEVRRAA